MGHAIFLDRPKNRFLVEALHDDGGSIARDGQPRLPPRRRVVERRRHEADFALRTSQNLAKAAPKGVSSLARRVGSGRKIPFGWPVVPDEYNIGHPFDLLGIGVPGKLGRRFIEIADGVAISWPIDNQAQLHAGAFEQRLARDCKMSARRDEDL